MEYRSSFFTDTTGRIPPFTLTILVTVLFGFFISIIPYSFPREQVFSVTVTAFPLIPTLNWQYIGQRIQVDWASASAPLFDTYGSSSNDPNISGDSSIKTYPVCRFLYSQASCKCAVFVDFLVFLCTYYTAKSPLNVDSPMFLTLHRRPCVHLMVSVFLDGYSILLIRINSDKPFIHLAYQLFNEF